MRLLARIAQTGSMTTTARQMHRTPAAVSAAVQRIEATLGIRIFERTTRTIHPTAEGLVVLEGCHDVVARWQRTLEEVQGTRHALSGTVHVSAPADTTYQVLAPVVLALCDTHPALNIVLHSSDTVHHLHRDALDMAIRYGALQDSSLTARKLAQTPQVLVASPAYIERYGSPKSPADLATHRCVTLQLGGVVVDAWTFRGKDTRETVALRAPLCADGHLTRRWAVEGRGVAMKSLFDVIDDLEAGRLVQLLPAWQVAPMAIHMVFPSRAYLPARVRAVDDAVTNACNARAARCDAWLNTDHNHRMVWPA